AEDGIRDFHVTGVQTCALPICSDNAGCGRWSARRGGKYNRVGGIEVRVVENVKEIRSELRAEALRQRESFRDRQIQLGQSRSLQIGRASCRERVETGGGA